MDLISVTVVASAVASGAVAGVTDTAAQAVKDAYAGLRELITDRYRHVDVSGVENAPGSEAKRGALAEDLADAGAGEDAELLAAARLVLAAVRAHAADTGPAIGVDLQRLEAAAVRIGEVSAQGIGVRGRDWAVTGDVEISGVRAGNPTEPPDPCPR